MLFVLPSKAPKSILSEKDGGAGSQPILDICHYASLGLDLCHWTQAAHMYVYGKGKQSKAIHIGVEIWRGVSWRQYSKSSTCLPKFRTPPDYPHNVAEHGFTRHLFYQVDNSWKVLM